MNMNDNRLVRYSTKAERDKHFMEWVNKNGMPKEDYGCINCGELICYEDCIGIKDERVKPIHIEL